MAPTAATTAVTTSTSTPVEATSTPMESAGWTVRSSRRRVWSTAAAYSTARREGARH